MKRKILKRIILGTMLCSVFVLVAGCSQGTIPAGDTTGGTTGGTTDGTTGGTTGGTTDGTTGGTTTPACKLDFESANIVTLTTSGFTAEVGDMNATWGDTSGSFTTPTRDMSYSANTSVYSSGAASLKVAATVYQNHWSPAVVQWSLNIDLSKAGLSAPVDLTGKTVSIKARVPAAGTLSSVKLVFKDKDGKASQAKEVPVTAKDTWTDVTYKYVDGGSATSDYTVTGFDITKVSSISVVAIKNGATSAADVTSETLYVDSLDW